MSHDGGKSFAVFMSLPGNGATTAPEAEAESISNAGKRKKHKQRQLERFESDVLCQPGLLVLTRNELQCSRLKDELLEVHKQHTTQLQKLHEDWPLETNAADHG